MPFFGLVWVASWVGCFVSSTQDLLHRSTWLPPHLPHSILTATSSYLTAHRSTGAPRLSTASPVAARSAAPTSSVSASQPATHRAPSPEATAQILSWLRTIGAPVYATAKPLSSKQSIPLTGRWMQNALFGVRVLAGTPQVPLKVSIAAIRDRRSHKRRAAVINSQAFSQAVLCLPRLKSDRPIWQIRVRDQVVAETFSATEATQTAKRIQSVVNALRPNVELQNSLKVVGAFPLQPAMKQGTPVGKFGGQILFQVDAIMAQAWNCNPELLAIAWVNNLRSALSLHPLALAEAQQAMYGVEHTDDRFGGMASWYGPYFHGRETATGERFDQTQLTAAHPALPFDTYLKVTNLNNGKSVIVRVNDRGPYYDNRTLDLSKSAAQLLGSEEAGVVPIEATIMQPSPMQATNRAIAQALQ